MTDLLLMDRASNEVRISVKGLEPGMYVCRLDRPWLEAAFPLEGLLVNSAADLQQLQSICAHVHVDTLRGTTPQLRYLELDTPAPVPGEQPREEYEGLRSTRWALTSDFSAELPQAEAAHAVLEGSIKELISDLNAKRAVDLPKLQHGVESMVASILRNPSAFAWLKAMKQADDYAYHHAMGCAIWAASFGRHLGLEKQELNNLALGGLLCDIGKIQLPPELFTCTGPLSEDERSVMQLHVDFGVAMLARIPGLPPGIAEMVATHHERHDGSGYPRGLKGVEIPIFGRIMGLVDSYDAMTSTRPHAPSRSPHRAVEELYNHRDTLFQAELVEQFIQSCGIYPTGSLVELASGEVGVVIEVHSLKRLRPRVMLLLDRHKAPLQAFFEIDLGEITEIPEDQRPSIKCGLPTGAYGIRASELFLD